MNVFFNERWASSPNLRFSIAYALSIMALLMDLWAFLEIPIWRSPPHVFRELPWPSKRPPGSVLVALGEGPSLNTGA